MNEKYLKAKQLYEEWNAPEKLAILNEDEKKRLAKVKEYLENNKPTIDEFDKERYEKAVELNSTWSEPGNYLRLNQEQKQRLTKVEKYLKTHEQAYQELTTPEKLATDQMPLQEGNKESWWDKVTGIFKKKKDEELMKEGNLQVSPTNNENIELPKKDFVQGTNVPYPDTKIKLKEEKPNILKSLKSSAYNIVGGTYGLGQMAIDGIYTIGAIPQNILAKTFNIEELEANPEKLYATFPVIKKAIDTALPANQVLESAKKNSAVPYFQNDLKGFLKEKDYSNFAKLLGYQVLENLPQQAIIWGTAIATGNPTIGTLTISGQAAGSKYMTINKDVRDYNKFANAVSTGMTEYLTETYLGTVPILKDLMKDRTGIFKQGFRAAIKDYLKTTGKAFTEEGLEEAVAQISENLIDIFSNNRDESGNLPGVFDGVFDATLVGSMTGGILGASGTAVNRFNSKQRLNNPVIEKDNQIKNIPEEETPRQQAETKENTPSSKLDTPLQEGNEKQPLYKIDDKEYSKEDFLQEIEKMENDTPPITIENDDETTKLVYDMVKGKEKSKKTKAKIIDFGEKVLGIGDFDQKIEQYEAMLEQKGNNEQIKEYSVFQKSLQILQENEDIPEVSQFYQSIEKFPSDFNTISKFIKIINETAEIVRNANKGETIQPSKATVNETKELQEIIYHLRNEFDLRYKNNPKDKRLPIIEDILERLDDLQRNDAQIPRRFDMSLEEYANKLKPTSISQPESTKKEKESNKTKKKLSAEKNNKSKPKYVKTSNGVFQVEKETENRWIFTNGTFANKKAKGNYETNEEAYRRSKNRRGIKRTNNTNRISLKKKNIDELRTPFLSHFLSTGMQTNDIDLQNYIAGIIPLYNKEGVGLDKIIHELDRFFPDLDQAVQGDIEAYKDGLLDDINRVYNLKDRTWDEEDIEYMKGMAEQQRIDEENEKKKQDLLKQTKEMIGSEFDLNDKVTWVDKEFGETHTGIVIEKNNDGDVRIQNDISLQVDDFETLPVLKVEKATKEEVKEKKKEANINPEQEEYIPRDDWENNLMKAREYAKNLLSREELDILDWTDKENIVAAIKNKLKKSNDQFVDDNKMEEKDQNTPEPDDKNKFVKKGETLNLLDTRTEAEKKYDREWRGLEQGEILDTPKQTPRPQADTPLSEGNLKKDRELTEAEYIAKYSKGKPLSKELLKEIKDNYDKLHDKNAQLDLLGEFDKDITEQDELFDEKKPQTLATYLEKKILNGEITDNPKLDKAVSEYLGGTKAEGKYTSQDAYNAIETAVNSILSKEEYSILSIPVKDALAIIDNLMSKLPTQTNRTQEKSELQQFSTPPQIAYLAAKALQVNKNDIILEPSAGNGGLIAMLKPFVKMIYANEIDTNREKNLQELGFKTSNVDAMQLNNLLPDAIKPTAIIMNPPFSSQLGISQNRNQVGYRHLLQALARLEKGGRLVAILGEGSAWGKPKAMEFWNRHFKNGDYYLRANIGIDGSEYRKYGTNFGVQLVIIDKLSKTGDILKSRDGKIENYSPVLIGEYKSIEEALNDIEARIPKRTQQDNRKNERPTSGNTRDRGNSTGSNTSDRIPIRPGGRTSVDIQRESDNDTKGNKPTIPGNREETKKPNNDINQRGENRDSRNIGGNVSNVEKLEIQKKINENESGGYVDYFPVKLSQGKKHPGKIVESSSLSAVKPPDITYKPLLPKSTIESGSISDIQLEAITYAGQRHSMLLPNGKRAGFFTGDGTGIGKGRTLAGIILDNYNQGRKKALWLSVSRDLEAASKDDLESIGAKHIPITFLGNYDKNIAIDLPEGVIFSTYNTFIRGIKNYKESRVKQIVEWLGNDGVIIMDEAHKQKNLFAGARGEPTQTGLSCQMLDDKLPKARIVYSSATGATNIQDIGYATRLGLWGEGSPFNDYLDFLNNIGNSGLGGLEMISRDMKSLGMYCSRRISYEGVEYRETIHELTPKQIEMYNVTANAWRVILENMSNVITEVIGSEKKGTFSKAITAYWGAHQRFYKSFITALKVPTAIKKIESELNKGHSVVLSLRKTNETAVTHSVSKAIQNKEDLSEIDLSPREIIAQFILHSFPINAVRQVPGPNDKLIEEIIPDVIDKEALAKRQELLDSLSKIDLPENPLDQIIDYFELYSLQKNDSTLRVAEITGRSKRMVKEIAKNINGKYDFTGKVEYKYRKAKGISNNKKNLHEMEQFQSGKKRIAIISAAGSTGISLHSDLRAKNQQRRVHITLELDWSADNQIQDFGRTHRSNQKQPPIFDLLGSNIGGEKRFLSTIANRLASMNAITQGSRQTEGSGEISKYDFESIYGNSAVENLYNDLLDNRIEEIDDNFSILKMMDILNTDNKINEKKIRDIKTFLNRILVLDIKEQNIIFDRFMNHFENNIQYAKEKGIFEEGFKTIKGLSTKKIAEDVVFTDSNGALTKYVEIEIDLPTNKQLFDKEKEYFIQKNSERIYQIKGYVNKTIQRTGEVEKHVNLINPAGNTHQHSINEFDDKFEVISQNAAQKIWEKEYAKAPDTKQKTYHIISGTILPHWKRITTTLGTKMRVYRFLADSGESIIGLNIPTNQIGNALKLFNLKKQVYDKNKIWNAVLEQGLSIPLTNNLELRIGKLSGEKAIELAEKNGNYINDYSLFSTLRNMGLINEQINWRQRFFVPSDKTKGEIVLDKILENYPIFYENEENAPDLLQKKKQIENAKFTKAKDISEKKISSGVISQLHSKKAKKIARQIVADKKGQKIGLRTIINYLKNIIPTTIYERSEQMRRKTPAHFHVSGNFIRTKGMNQSVYHEIGHAIYHLLLDKHSINVNALTDDLTELAENSEMASAINPSEGFAEWIRKFIVEPETLETELSDNIISLIKTAKPEILKGLEDAQILHSIHLSRTPAAIFSSMNKDLPKSKGWESFKETYGYFLFGIAKGYGIEQIDRKIASMIKNEAETKKEGIKLARDVWRKEIQNNADFLSSYQNTLRIPMEVNDILFGTKFGKNGVKVLDDSGEYIYLSDTSFKQIFDKIGNKNWNDFEQYAWGKVSIDRWNVKKIKYAGILDGINPTVLESINDEYEKKHPEFSEILAELKEFYDALLDVAVLSGEFTEKEAKTIKEKYEHYVPLTKIIPEQMNYYLSNKKSPSSGIKGLKGGSYKSNEDLITATEKRVNGVIQGYYWNKLIKDIYRASELLQTNDKLPYSVRTFAGRFIAPLKLDPKVMINLSEDEQRKIIADYLNEEQIKNQIQEAMEISGAASKDELMPEVFQLEEEITADDIDYSPGYKPIFSMVKPKAINVVSTFYNGEKKYLQINDTLMFMVFAQSKKPSEAIKWLDRILTPMVQAWKGPVTGNLPFALFNFTARDMYNAVFMGNDKQGLIPFYYAYKGLKNRIDNKFPEARKLDELLTRSYEVTNSTAQTIRINKFKNILKKGVVLENWQQLSGVEKLANYPGIFMHLLTKPAYLALHFTGQTKLAELSEELNREGKFVAEKEKGSSTAKANMGYDQLTGNFAESSGYADLKHFIRTLGFVNAGFQIQYRQFLKLTDPIEYKHNLMRMIYTGMLLPAIFWGIKTLLSTKADEDREKERPEEDKYAFQDFKGLRIPFDYGHIGAMQSFTVNMLDYQFRNIPFGEKKKAAKLILNRLMEVPGPTTAFSPLIKTFVEAKANYNFYFDKPIEAWWMANLDVEERRYASTPKIYNKITELTKMSPLKIQHIIRNGINREYDYTLSLADRLQKGQLTMEYMKKNKADIPYIGRIFIRNPIGWNSASVKKLSLTLENEEEMENNLIEKKENLINKYGITYKDKEEYANFQIQLNSFRQLQSAYKAIKSLGEIYKEEEKKDNPDWSLIEDIKAEMVRIASEALLNTELPEEK